MVRGVAIHKNRVMVGLHAIDDLDANMQNVIGSKHRILKKRRSLRISYE
jgi:hypothetical protein